MEKREPAKDLGWHTMSGEFLLHIMRRCYEGEDPDLVFAEIYANAEREPSSPKPYDQEEE